MNKRDQQLLAEAYLQVDEGILRRAGSNIAGGLKKLKSIPGTVKGTAKELGGKALSGMGAQKAGAELQQVGQADKAAAKAKGAGGKEEHFKTSLLAEIEKDVQSLGVVKDVKGFMAAITNVLDTHIPSGEQSFVSKTVGAQSPVTVNDPPAAKETGFPKIDAAAAAPPPQKLKTGKKSPSSGGEAKLGPAFQRQAAPAKKKRPKRVLTRAQKDRKNQLAREARAKKKAAKKPKKKTLDEIEAGLDDFSAKIDALEKKRQQSAA